MIGTQSTSHGLDVIDENEASVFRAASDDDDIENEEADVLVLNDALAPVWDIQDFDIAKKLGKGQFGEVYLAREKRTNFVLAIKAIKKCELLNTRNEHLLRREIDIHSHLIHPHILNFYGWFTTQDHICLMLEIAPRGELMSQLGDGGLDEDVVSRYMFQIVSAIRTCHFFNVMHRDLKPENIMVDLEGNLKLADFGWAAHIPEENLANDYELTASRNRAEESSKRFAENGANAKRANFDYLRSRRKTYCGTLDYLSPEICRHEWYGKEVDIWCLGTLCYELATGGPPFPHVSYRDQGIPESEARNKQQRDILESDLSSRLHSWFSEELKDFLSQTLEKNPDKRPTADSLLQHPFITKHNNSSFELEAARVLNFQSTPPYPSKANAKLDADEKGKQNGKEKEEENGKESKRDECAFQNNKKKDPPKALGLGDPQVAKAINWTKNISTPVNAQLNEAELAGWHTSRIFISALSSPNSGVLGEATNRTPFLPQSAAADLFQRKSSLLPPHPSTVLQAHQKTLAS